MELNEIKLKLESTEYDFLRTDKHLGNNIMLLTLGGSHAYGTQIEGSDLDIRGCFAPQKKELIGLSRYEEFENKKTDTVIHSLDKIINLMISSNPNIIELFGTKEEHIFVMTPEGKLLKDNLNIFLSRKAAHSFGGYAQQQLRRCQNAIARDSSTQSEKENHILNSIKYGMESVKNNYRDLNNGFINLFIDESDKDDYDTEIYMDIELKHYPLRDFKSMYSDMSNVIRDYDKIGQRNKKKDETHLQKHCMHLFRLYTMGIEVLQGKGVQTYREKDLPMLMDIRNGKIPLEEVFAMVESFEKDFKYAKDNSPLPESPDHNKIEELVMEIKTNLLRKYGI